MNHLYDKPRQSPGKLYLILREDNFPYHKLRDEKPVCAPSYRSPNYKRIKAAKKNISPAARQELPEVIKFSGSILCLRNKWHTDPGTYPENQANTLKIIQI